MTTQATNAQKIRIRRVKEQGADLVGQQLVLKGWIRTVRHQKTFSFIEINDGSCLSNFQIIADSGAEDLTIGAAIIATGEIVESPGKGQAVEMKSSSIELVGASDAETYPLQKKRHSFEFLRTIAHLRPRTNSLGAVARIRNTLNYATHRFFQERDFMQLHAPIITASDAEGAGELFRVTTLDPTKAQKDEQDFFGKKAYLTCSGQLNAEIYALAFTDVYTFGPTFRAENSNTSRHLAEFWMIEPELAFTDIHGNMDNAEEYLKFVFKAVLDECQEDLALCNKFIKPGIIEQLEHVVKTPFARITYTEAVEILEKSEKTFEFPVSWGVDLQSEHERYLSEEHFKGPVIVVDYPKGIKAFYMRLNDDNKTVAAMDILVPGIGEIVGGSQREERLDVLENRIEEAGLSKDDYWWYLELRKYGTVPHAGYGVGFERIVQYATGMENIREVIPFPRTPGHADF